MTGRKDIPTIHLVYSEKAAKGHESDIHKTGYLQYLGNQREKLRKAVMDAPRYRLDNLAAFVETHGERISHLLEALISYRRRKSFYRWRLGFWGLFLGFLAGAGALVVAMVTGLAGAFDPVMLFSGAAGVAVVFFLGWLWIGMGYFSRRFHEKQLNDLESLTPLKTQTRRDNWEAIGPKLKAYLRKTKGQFSTSEVRSANTVVRKVCDQGSREVREALSELATLRDDQFGVPEGRILPALSRSRPDQMAIDDEGI